MLNENTLTELLSVLKATLNKLGATETQITKIQNSAIIDGNGSAIFQGIHNSPINISLALSDPQVLATLAQQILQQSQSPKPSHHIGDPWQPNTIFFGRTQDMETITEQLRTSKALLLLNGIGGMGKTALANQLRYQIGDQYDHVIWTNLQNVTTDDEQPLRNHLLYNSIQLHQDLGIGDVLRSERDETQKWAIIVRALRQLGSNVLWIIDNAHQQDQSAIKALPDNCHILLTSRHTIGDISTHYVDELNPNDALDLFKHYYKRPDDDQIILDVCGAVGYHALSVELLAKTLNELPNKGVSFLLQELKNRGININRQQQIWTDYAQRETYLNECLLAAFDLGKLREQTDLHGLLRFFCLMPYQDVAYAVVQQLTQTVGDTAEDQLLRHLQQLSKLGWLKPNQINWFGTTQKSWKMHTVIQDIVQQQLGHDESLEDGVADVLRTVAFGYYEENEITAQEWRSFLEAMVKKVDREVMPIAWCYSSLSSLLNAMGHYDKALLNQQKALNIAEQILPAQHLDLTSLYNNIGLIYNHLTQYDIALSYYKRCKVILKKKAPTKHPNLASLYLNMAIVYDNLTQYGIALAYYGRCHEIREETLPAQHPDLARLYMNIGNTYLRLAQYDIALAYYERCRAIWEQILSTQHPSLAMLYMNMAITYRNLTQYESALAYYERCQAIREQILPAQHPDLASLYMNMAVTYSRLTQYDTALTYYERCRTIFEQILPTQHPNLAGLYMNIASTYDSLTQYDTALAYYERCRTIFEQILPTQHPDLAGLYMNIASTYDSLTQYDTALAYYERCHTIFEQILPTQHPNLASLYMNMAVTYSRLTQYDTALTYYERCRAIREQILPAQHPDLATLYMNMAGIYELLTQHNMALVYCKYCCSIFEQILSSQHPDLATLYMNVANVYRSLTRYDISLTYYGRCKAIREQILPAQHPDLAMLYMNIGILYIHQSQFLKAKTFIDQSVAIYKQTLPPEHLYLQYTLELQNHIHQNLSNK